MRMVPANVATNPVTPRHPNGSGSVSTYSVLVFFTYLYTSLYILGLGNKYWDAPFLVIDFAGRAMC